MAFWMSGKKMGVVLKVKGVKGSTLLVAALGTPPKKKQRCGRNRSSGGRQC